MFETLKNLFKKSQPVSTPSLDKPPTVEIEPEITVQKKPRKPRQKKVVEPTPPPTPALSAKAIATANNEPYIEVINMEIDGTDMHSGAFTFDYNDKFIVNLVKAGYKLKESDSDEMLVDRWFQNVCRNIALEIYEQEIADPEKRAAMENLRIIRTRNIGNGRSEIS